MKQKLLLVTVFLAFIIVAALGYMFFVLGGDFVPEEDPITIEIISVSSAKQAAQANLELFDTWRGPQLGETFVYYDLDGNPSAYQFNVADLYGKAGYIIISATTKAGPVITLSTQPDSPVSNLFKITNELSKNTIREYRDIKTELIYLGGDDFFTRLTFREGDETFAEFHSLAFDIPNEISPDLIEQKWSEYRDLDPQRAEPAWREVLSQKDSQLQE